MTEEGFWEEERVAFNGNPELKSFFYPFAAFKQNVLIWYTLKST